MVLIEAKIFGIPTILCGLDYLALAKEGTVIIYDDSPYTLAKESIKILKNETYRKRLGTEARKSMENKKNNLLVKRWIKLIYSVYKGDDKSLQELNKKVLKDEEAEQILYNQLNLIHKRIPKLKNATIEQLKNYSLS